MPDQALVTKLYPYAEAVFAEAATGVSYDFRIGSAHIVATNAGGDDMMNLIEDRPLAEQIAFVVALAGVAQIEHKSYITPQEDGSMFVHVFKKGPKAAARAIHRRRCRLTP